MDASRDAGSIPAASTSKALAIRRKCFFCKGLGCSQDNTLCALFQKVSDFVSDLYHEWVVIRHRIHFSETAMPRRKPTGLKSIGMDAKGRYFRNLGYLSSGSGKYTQKKFYVGYDEDFA